MTGPPTCTGIAVGRLYSVSGTDGSGSNIGTLKLLNLGTLNSVQPFRLSPGRQVGHGVELSEEVRNHVAGITRSGALYYYVSGDRHNVFMSALDSGAERDGRTGACVRALCEFEFRPRLVA